MDRSGWQTRAAYHYRGHGKLCTPYTTCLTGRKMRERRVGDLLAGERGRGAQGMIDFRRESNFRVEQIGEDRNRSGLPSETLAGSRVRAERVWGDSISHLFVRLCPLSLSLSLAVHRGYRERNCTTLSRAHARLLPLIALETPFVIYIFVQLLPQLVGCYYSIVYRYITALHSFPITREISRAPFTILPCLASLFLSPPFKILIKRNKVAVAALSFRNVSNQGPLLSIN